jgi:serine/threonine-protein kinase
MELVEGPTLADRIAAGRLPTDEALPIARQIAEALEAAHAQGIVHRDLKPANIKVRPDGTVKVLDFGLAKLDAGGATGATPATAAITSPAMTAAGVILGTAAYMAPEQARGTLVDARADVWAFGAVLFEMLAGKRAFEGDLTSDVLASVLKSHPQWQTLPADTPLPLRRLIRRCLEKDPRRRLQSIGDARIEIEDLMSGQIDHAAVVTAHAAPTSFRRLPWFVAAGMAAAALVLLWLWSPWRAAPAREAIRVNADLGADVTLVTANTGASAILSPDGSLLAFVGRTSPGSRPQLFVRRLSQLDASPLPDTTDAINPFFSPDGQWIGFFTLDKLKKISIAGGAAVTLCEATNSRGGTWSADGTIIFSENRSGLFRVAASGGAREALTTLADGEVTHRHPQILPGGQAVLYTAHTAPDAFDNAYLVVRSLASGTQTVVHRGGYFGRYASSGHLLYVRQRTLFAAPFDLERLATTGRAVPIIEDVSANDNRGEAHVALSDAGTLTYIPQPQQAFAVPIAWVDRRGQSSPLRATPAWWEGLLFAPDGRRAAMAINDGKQFDIWIHELERDVISRLTLHPANDAWPVWTPDGRAVAFTSDRGDNKSTGTIFWQRTDGAHEAQPLSPAGVDRQDPTSWHPSGKVLAYTQYRLTEPPDIMMLPLEGSVDTGFKPGAPVPFANTPFREGNAKFSPDGRWVAYESFEAGRPQIYVRPFQRAGERVQISTSGGQHPRWSSRGELLFNNLTDQVMVVAVKAVGDSFTAGRPELWANVRMPSLARGFDVHPSSERVAAPPIVPEDAARRDAVILVFNFLDEVRRATGLR